MQAIAAIRTGEALVIWVSGGVWTTNERKDTTCQTARENVIANNPQSGRVLSMYSEWSKGSSGSRKRDTVGLRRMHHKWTYWLGWPTFICSDNDCRRLEGLVWLKNNKMINKVNVSHRIPEKEFEFWESTEKTASRVESNQITLFDQRFLRWAPLVYRCLLLMDRERP